MTTTTKIEQGDIVRVPGSDEEWKVFWIYGNGQVELVNKFHRDYPEIVRIDQLELVRKKGASSS